MSFLQRSELALRVGAAVKHVIAEKISAGSNVRHIHRGDISGLHEGTTMIGKFHAATGFRQKIWIVRKRFIFLAGEASQVRGLIIHVTLQRKEKSLVGRCFAWVLLPKTIWICSEHRDDFLRRKIRAGPSGDSEKRRIDAALHGELFQRADVRSSGIRSTPAVFVLQLNA